MPRWTAAFALALLAAASSQADNALAAPNADRLGWRLGVQAYSFNKLTLFETIDRVQALGLRYLEAYPNQRLSNATNRLPFNHHLAPDVREQVRARLDAAGVRLVNYGVVPLPNDEAQCRKVFDFAKAMRIETLTSEPPDDALPLVDRLGFEYGINVAIHNHPKPSENWDPEKVLAECAGLSARVGVCADTSHWMRSGVDVVQALKRLEGRIVCFHLGDVDPAARARYLEHGDDPNDATWAAMVKRIQGIPNVAFAQGTGDIEAWLREIRRQKIHAVFAIEAFYDMDPDDAMQPMRQSIAYFEEIATKLSQE